MNQALQNWLVIIANAVFLASEAKITDNKTSVLSRAPYPPLPFPYRESTFQLLYFSLRNGNSPKNVPPPL